MVVRGGEGGREGGGGSDMGAGGRGEVNLSKGELFIQMVTQWSKLAARVLSLNSVPSCVLFGFHSQHFKITWTFPI